jgi:hypothetical protein
VCVGACHLWIKAGYIAPKNEKAQLWRQDEIARMHAGQLKNKMVAKSVY